MDELKASRQQQLLTNTKISAAKSSGGVGGALFLFDKALLCCPEAMAATAEKKMKKNCLGFALFNFKSHRMRVRTLEAAAPAAKEEKFRAVLE